MKKLASVLTIIGGLCPPIECWTKPNPSDQNWNVSFQLFASSLAQMVELHNDNPPL